MNYPDYDTLREEYEAGNITAVDFVLQQSDEVTEDYHQFCKDEAPEPTLSENIIKLQITDNHILYPMQSKSKSF